MGMCGCRQARRVAGRVQRVAGRVHRVAARGGGGGSPTDLPRISHLELCLLRGGDRLQHMHPDGGEADAWLGVGSGLGV